MRATADPLATRYAGLLAGSADALAGAQVPGMPERRLIRARSQRTRPDSRSRAGPAEFTPGRVKNQPGTGPRISTYPTPSAGWDKTQR